MTLHYPRFAKFSFANVALSLSTLLISAHVGGVEPLRILIWEDFIASELLESWTKETGSAVKLAYFDSDEERDSIIAESKARFDVVLVDGLSSLAFSKRELFLDISEQSIPNLKYIDPRFKPMCREGKGGSLSLGHSWPGLPQR